MAEPSAKAEAGEDETRTLTGQPATRRNIRRYGLYLLLSAAVVGTVGYGSLRGGPVALYNMTPRQADAKNVRYAKIWKKSRKTEEQGWPPTPKKFKIPRFNNAPHRSAKSTYSTCVFMLACLAWSHSDTCVLCTSRRGSLKLTWWYVCVATSRPDLGYWARKQQPAPIWVDLPHELNKPPEGEPGPDGVPESGTTVVRRHTYTHTHIRIHTRENVCVWWMYRDVWCTMLFCMHTHINHVILAR